MCNCRQLSRFDADGNLCVLYSCRRCLERALEDFRKQLDRTPDLWIQLELREEEEAAERSEDPYRSFKRQDGGSPSGNEDILKWQRDEPLGEQ